MGLMDVAAKAAQGFAGAAGDTDSQAQIGNWQDQRQNQRQQQLQLAIAPLSQSLAADRERLKAFTDPNTGEPVEEHQADYDKIHNRMVDTIGQMRELLGQHPPGETPFATRLLDKFHVANDLSNHFQNKRTDQVNQYYAQNRAMADAAANGSFEPNPYTTEARQLTQAGFTPEESHRAVAMKAGIVPKLTPDGQPYQGTDGKWYQNLKDAYGNLTQREMPANYNGKDMVDTRKRADFEKFKVDYKARTGKDYTGSFEEYLKNPSGEAKPGTPRIGMSGGKNVYALLTPDGWIDAGTHQPLNDFRPLPTFAQQGLYGIDLMQAPDGTITSALLNRRTGQFKPITGAGGAPIAPAVMAQVTKNTEPALEADTRFRVMKDSEQEALNGNQQAMLNIVSNHIGMTLGLQKGARISQAIWNEAIATAPWLQRVGAKWDSDGYLSGVTLSPQQIKQMVQLGQDRRKRQWQQAQQAGAIYGVNVPIPDDLDNPSTTLEGPKTKSLKTQTKKTADPLGVL